MNKRFVSFDWVIKHKLRDKANYVIVEGFLSELLGQSIQIQEVLESESNKETLWDKYNRVDILVKNQPEQLIIIELQYEAEHDYLQRILYGTSKLLTEYLQAGEAYAAVKKIISVSLVYFDLGQGEDYLYHGTTNFIGTHRGDTLQLQERQQRQFTCQTISQLYSEYYLIKVANFSERIQDRLDEWVYFFKKEELAEPVTAQGLREAKERLEVLRLPEAERRAYEAHLEHLRYQRSMELSFWHEGFANGEQRGYHRGILEGRINLAKNLLATLELTDEVLSQVTGLTITQIESLRTSATTN